MFYLCSLDGYKEQIEECLGYGFLDGCMGQREEESKTRSGVFIHHYIYTNFFCTSSQKKVHFAYIHNFLSCKVTIFIYFFYKQIFLNAFCFKFTFDYIFLLGRKRIFLP